MTPEIPPSPVTPAMRARNRRLTWLLALVAFGVYAAFIATSVLHSKG